MYRLALSLAVFFQAGLVAAHPIIAASIPSVPSVASQLEERYHLNLQELQSKGEAQNVADQKVLAPEVSLFFSPADPRPGEEITAIANPLFFQNDKEDLYYTWYLKRDGCGLDDDPSQEKRDECDFDDDGEITVEDWKVEAMRIYANNAFDATQADYETSFRDSDEYEAYLGGHARRQVPERCYILDRRNGELYELSGVASGNFNCPSGTSPRCVEDDTLVCPAEFEASASAEATGGSGGSGGGDGEGGSGGSGGSASSETSVEGETFIEYRICRDVKIRPVCLRNTSMDSEDTTDGTPYCGNGTPRCMPDSSNSWGQTCASVSSSTPCSSSGSSIASCTASASTVSDNLCDENRMFPDAPGEETGDGDFDPDEEEFWLTDPEDPDTANTGYGDEANVSGRGAMQFTWNYQVGDQVGVAVEGTSLIATKYADHSNMIMWAFPKNDCSVYGKSSYDKSIRGYQVNILTADMDLNDCIPENLVDPREGGQSDNLDVSLTYAPDEPVNDSSGDDYGETLAVYSTVSNSSKGADHVFYDWEVYISSNGSHNPRGYSRDDGDEGTASWVDITQALTDNDLVALTEGNGVTELSIALNLDEEVLGDVGIVPEGVFPERFSESGYLRVKLTAREQFSQEVYREGTSTVIVKVVNSDTKIIPSIAQVDDSGTFIPGDLVICSDELSLRRGVCYVAKNEVIALSLNEEGLDSYSWELDGAPLVCDSDVSSICEDSRQTQYTFFPVTGESGTRHTVQVSALESETGQTKSFTRVFEVVDPFVEMISADTSSVWPKYLGYYRDTDGVEYDDISTDVLQGYSGAEATLEALFFPAFIGESEHTDMQWVTSATDASADGTSLSFSLLAGPGVTYNATMEAVYRQPLDVREAMKNIWNLVIADTSDYWLEKSVQVEVLQDSEYEEFAVDSPRAFFASLAVNAPAHLWLLVQALLSVAVAVFVLGTLYALARK